MAAQGLFGQRCHSELRRGLMPARGWGEPQRRHYAAGSATAVIGCRRRCETKEAFAKPRWKIDRRFPCLVPISDLYGTEPIGGSTSTRASLHDLQRRRPLRHKMLTCADTCASHCICIVRTDEHDVDAEEAITKEIETRSYLPHIYPVSRCIFEPRQRLSERASHQGDGA